MACIVLWSSREKAGELKLSVVSKHSCPVAGEGRGDVHLLSFLLQTIVPTQREAVVVGGSAPFVLKLLSSTRL